MPPLYFSKSIRILIKNVRFHITFPFIRISGFNLNSLSYMTYRPTTVQWVCCSLFWRVSRRKQKFLGGRKWRKALNTGNQLESLQPIISQSLNWKNVIQECLIKCCCFPCLFIMHFMFRYVWRITHTMISRKFDQNWNGICFGSSNPMSAKDSYSDGDRKIGEEKHFFYYACPQPI